MYIILNTNLKSRYLKMGPIPLEERLHICLDTEKLQKYIIKIIHNLYCIYLILRILILIIFLIIHIKLLLHK